MAMLSNIVKGKFDDCHQFLGNWYKRDFRGGISGIAWEFVARRFFCPFVVVEFRQMIEFWNYLGGMR
jgi:hypothetical protein